MKFRRRLSSIGLCALAALCALSAAATGASSDAPTSDLKARYKWPTDIPFLEDNPYSEAKVALGQMLFFDPRVSGAGNASCSTCHNPGLGWGDGMSLGTGAGAKKLGRRSPTILDLAWAEPLFWDGRAANLEDQATGPMLNPAEMNQTMPVLVDKLGAIPGYRRMFDKAFPGESINAKTIAKAIGAFERTIVSAKAPFDRWIAGDETAISDSAKRGFALFNGKARCAACHTGWRFTDDSFHDIGLKSDDIGRGKYVPDVVIMQHAFKTPGLRNIAQRAPYMHDGSVATLRDVVLHYDSGFIERPSLSPEMVRLHLSPSEVDDLVAFMLTLTSVDKPIAIPMLPTKEAQ